MSSDKAPLHQVNRVVKWFPPSRDIRVEELPIPTIQDPDDAIVKVTLSGLCGSDLHVYRGHSGFQEPIVCGHEFLGEIVALGENYGENALVGRPSLYKTLKVGDQVISPFSTSCGECKFCRIGFTCRCSTGLLFGSPKLPGGQAQYVRVPKAGGHVFSLTAYKAASDSLDMSKISESSLLLLADILPTGVFAALQVLSHPKLSPVISGKAYPTSLSRPYDEDSTEDGNFDETLTVVVLGLGPVGICAIIHLLDALSSMEFKSVIFATDPVPARREKMESMYGVIDPAEMGNTSLVVAPFDRIGQMLRQGTHGVGADSVLEAVGNNSALTLAYGLVRPFGTIISVGVHQDQPLPFTGRQLYDKNVSLDFGRCPARSFIPIALDLLVRRQDLFGAVGTSSSLVDKIFGLDDAPIAYELFDQGKIGKVFFDPWNQGAS